jgi:hypothetical protein
VPHRRLFVPLAFALAVQAPAQDPLTKQALDRIAECEAQEGKIAAGDRQAALLCINRLDWAGKRLQAVRDKSETTWQDASRRYQDLRSKLEAKASAAAGPAAGAVDQAKLRQLDREVKTATHNFNLVPAKMWTDEYRAKSTRKEIAALEQRLGEFPAGEAEVQAVAQRLAALAAAFAGATTQVGADRKAAAAITERLAALDQKYGRDAMLTAVQPPYSEAQLRAFAADIRRWRDQALPDDLAFLRTAASNAAVDHQHVDRLRHWLATSWSSGIDTAERTVRDSLASAVDAGQRAADFILATDAGDKDQVTNRILGKGRFDDNMARLREGAHAVAMAKVFDEAMGATAGDRPAQADKVSQAIAHLQRLAVTALDTVRMPEPASTDAELLRVAEATLRRPEYAVKGWERIVINADKQRKERREAYVSPGTVTTTISYYHYVWDEVQVTTAEKVGADVWLFVNTLKHYQSGDPTTPVGRWIVSQRFESTRILPENVAK